MIHDHQIRLNNQKYEQMKIEIEREKIELEKKKLAAEQNKNMWSAISSIAPILVALFTVLYGVWSINENSKINIKLEAAKAVFNESGPDEAAGRAEYYSQLFPELIGRDLFKKVDPIKFEKRNDARLEFFKAIAENHQSAPELFDLWSHLFPDDDWVKYDGIRDILVRLERAEKNKKTDSQKQH